eukprot:s159_g29.t1
MRSVASNFSQASRSNPGKLVSRQGESRQKGVGVIARTETKFRPFDSILIFTMRSTAFQQLQANEDFSNTGRRANLCVSICTGRSSCCMSSSLTRPPFTLPSAVSSQNQFKHSVAESNRFRGTAANWRTLFAYHISLLIQNRIDTKRYE